MSFIIGSQEARPVIRKDTVVAWPGVLSVQG